MKRYFSIMAAIAAALMLSAACGDDDATDDSVSGGDSSATPTLTLVQSSVTATYEGGEFSVAYSVSNPTSDGILVASASGSWVENIDYSSTDGFVKFSIPSYTQKSSRSCVLTLTYEYSNTSISKTVAITQEGYNVYDELTCQHADMYYYGSLYTSSSSLYEYYVIFSDNGIDLDEDGTMYLYANSNYIVLSFISSTAPADHDNIMVPEGTYTISSDGSDGTISPDYAEFMAVGSSSTEEDFSIVSGSVTVSHSSGSTAIVSGTVVDEKGGSHPFTFDGSFNLLYDMTQVSSLTEDVTTTINTTTQIACYYGDYFGNGGNVWYLYMYNSEEGVYLAFVAEGGSTSSNELPTGTFVGASDGSAGTYLKGFYNGNLVNSWYFNVDGNYIDDPCTPLGEGTVKITSTGSGSYQFVTDCYDDKGAYKVNATINCTFDTGDYVDYSSSSLAKQSLSPQESGTLKSLKIINRYPVVKEF